MSEINNVIGKLQKQTWNRELETTGFFCQICGHETENAHDLIHFESPETVQSLNVCHDCLPEYFE